MTPVLVLQIEISWENRELVFIFFLKRKCWITECLKWPKTKTTKHISTNYSVIFLSRKSFENLKFDLNIPISEFLSLPYPFFFFLSSSLFLLSFSHFPTCQELMLKLFLEKCLQDNFSNTKNANIIFITSIFSPHNFLSRKHPLKELSFNYASYPSLSFLNATHS